MSTAPGAASKAVAMGFEPGVAVQELGWDSDADEQLRDEIQDLIGGGFVYGALEAVDGVLLRWRAGDGDRPGGLVIPKVGRAGYVEPTDLAEAALTAGLALANPASVSADWQAHKLVRPKGVRR